MARKGYQKVTYNVNSNPRDPFTSPQRNSFDNSDDSDFGQTLFDSSSFNQNKNNFGYNSRNHNDINDPFYSDDAEEISMADLDNPKKMEERIKRNNGDKRSRSSSRNRTSRNNKKYTSDNDNTNNTSSYNNNNNTDNPFDNYDEFDDILDIDDNLADDEDDTILERRQFPNVDFDEIPKNKLKGQTLLYLTSVFVSLGVFIFGYDQGYMSGVIVNTNFEKYYNHPSSIEIGTVVAVLEIGALIASLFLGKISNKIGRKRTIIIGAFLFIIGGFIQSLSPTLLCLGAGRLVSGFGIGFLSGIVPVYQSEISPSEARGRMGCIEFTGNILGYSSSIWIDYGCSFFKGDISFRMPIITQCILGGFLFIGGFFIVESPRWLLEKDKDQEGFHVLNLLYSDSGELNKAKEEFLSIKRQVINEKFGYDVSFENARNSQVIKTNYFTIIKRHKYRIFIGCSALFWAQFNGINLISYYAPLVFEQAGFKGRTALLVTGINSLIYLASTIPTWFLVDKWGRRPILITGGIWMGIALILISFFMYQSKSYTSLAVAILVIFYNSGFGYSWGPIPWLYANEIYSDSTVRGVGAALATAVNWFSNFVVGEGSPILLEVITWRLYAIYGIICLLSSFFAYKFYPETSGVELEDMDKLFDKE